MFENDWITFPNINNYSTFNSEHEWEELCIRLKNQQTCTSENYYTEEVQFQSGSCKCFVVDLLMQQEFCCVI